MEKPIDSDMSAALGILEKAEKPEHLYHKALFRALLERLNDEEKGALAHSPTYKNELQELLYRQSDKPAPSGGIPAELSVWSAFEKMLDELNEAELHHAQSSVTYAMELTALTFRHAGKESQEKK